MNLFRLINLLCFIREKVISSGYPEGCGRNVCYISDGLVLLALVDDTTALEMKGLTSKVL